MFAFVRYVFIFRPGHFVKRSELKLKNAEEYREITIILKNVLQGDLCHIIKTTCFLTATLLCIS